MLRDVIDPLGIPQCRNVQPQIIVQINRRFPLAFHVLQLKTQIDAAKVLVHIQRAEKSHHHAQHRTPVQLSHLHRFQVPPQSRIINPLHRVHFHHHCFFLAHHNYTFSAHRNFALRDLGFSCCSASPGTITCLVSTLIIPFRCCSWNACFTGRSSREWYVSTTSRPPEFIVAGVRKRNCPSSSISRFPAIRSARNVFVAGCSLCLPHWFRTPATTVARCAVSLIGRARTMALAILLESCSSASR